MANKLDSLVSQLNKKYKRDIVLKGTELKRVSMIPFTSPKANWVTRGGVAEGKIIEFYGAEGGGKTTSALDILRNYQALYPERLALYLDAENTLDIEWAEKLGVNMEQVILIKPEAESAEMLLDMVLDAMRSGEVGLVVVDSIPFLLPKAVIEGSLDDKTYAGNSAVMTIFASKVVPTAHAHNCTVIMINQIRDKMGVHYTAYNTPGGKALKHSYIQRIMFRKGAYIDENNREQASTYESPAGHIIQMKVEKNKATKNDRKVSNYTLNYEYGIDTLTDTVELAIQFNLIQQAGAWYTLYGQQYQGKARVIEHIRNTDGLFERLYSEVNQINLL